MSEMNTQRVKEIEKDVYWMHCTACIASSESKKELIKALKESIAIFRDIEGTCQECFGGSSNEMVEFLERYEGLKVD